jgi:hypothetical protein
VTRRTKLPPSPFDSPRSLRKRHVDACVNARMAFSHLADLHSNIIQADREDGHGPATVYLESAQRAATQVREQLAGVDAYIAAGLAEAKRLDELAAEYRRRTASQKGVK